MINNILMVCTGNVCRSPMAEYYLKDRLKNTQGSLKISSAGIHALADHHATLGAQNALKKHNIDCLQHRGRQITEEIIKQSDLILAAEKLHKYNIIGDYPFARGKIHLMHDEMGIEIPDPYQRSDQYFDKAMTLIIEGLNEWSRKFDWY